jgi:hypothetical protein
MREGFLNAKVRSSLRGERVIAREEGASLAEDHSPLTEVRSPLQKDHPPRTEERSPLVKVRSLNVKERVSRFEANPWRRDFADLRKID